jgi:hypothetical protein
MEKIRRTSRAWHCTVYPEYVGDISEYIPEDINTPRIARPEILFDMLATNDKIKYFCFQGESGVKTEHEHIHLYLETHTPQRFSFLQKIIGKQHHFEIAKGEREHNIDYIKHTGEHQDKEGEVCTNFFEHGKPHETESRDGGVYSIACDMLLEGKSIPYIVKSLKGGILSQVGNLCRLQACIEEEERRRGKEIENTVSLLYYKDKLAQADIALIEEINKRQAAEQELRGALRN